MPCLNLPMRLSGLFLCCGLLTPYVAASRPAPKQHHAPKKARQQIEDLEEQWRIASINGDAASMDKLLSDDYVGISWTGQINTKAMQLDRVRTKSLTVRRMDLMDVKIKVVDSIAIVTVRADVDSTTDGSESSGEFRYTRVYQRLPSGVWKITNFEATRVPSGDRRRRGAPAPPGGL